MTQVLVTLDTNLVDPSLVETLESLLNDVPHELAFISVTEREHGYEVGYLAHRVHETAVWGESLWGSANWGGSIPAQIVLDESTLAADDGASGRYDVLADADDLLERLLAVIGDGSFPKVGERVNLTQGVRRQLRDAMILGAHVRAGRHVLLSNDERAYVRHGKREKLESLCRTKILTLNELRALLAEGRGAELFRAG